MSGVARSLSHARWETGLLLRNGEQLLLTLVIPVAVLLMLTQTDVFGSASGSDRLPQALVTALTVSVMGSAFTSLAIATGFERRSGALRFLSTTPLTRMELLAGKLLATGAVVCVSVVAALITALAVGWRPMGSAAWAVPVLLLSTASFAAWGFALAGLLRAEAVLAVANGLFLLLLMFGGVVIPAASLPAPLSSLAGWLPSGATVDALSAAMVHGQSPGPVPVLVLVAWLAGGALVASRSFRWT